MLLKHKISADSNANMPFWSFLKVEPSLISPVTALAINKREPRLQRRYTTDEVTLFPTDATMSKSHAIHYLTPCHPPLSVSVLPLCFYLVSFWHLLPRLFPCQTVKLQSPGLSTAWHTDTKFTEQGTRASQNSKEGGKWRKESKSVIKQKKKGQQRVLMFVEPQRESS